VVADRRYGQVTPWQARRRRAGLPVITKSARDAPPATPSSSPTILPALPGKELRALGTIAAARRSGGDFSWIREERPPPGGERCPDGQEHPARAVTSSGGRVPQPTGAMVSRVKQRLIPLHQAVGEASPVGVELNGRVVDLHRRWWLTGVGGLPRRGETSPVMVELTGPVWSFTSLVSLTSHGGPSPGIAEASPVVGGTLTSRW